MSFGDIASRFKKHQDATEQAQLEQEALDYPELYAIRERIIGVLIRDARVAKGYTTQHLAQEIGVDNAVIVDWEFGRQSPSLPEIEIISYMLEVPVSQFLRGTETLVNKLHERMVDQAEYIQTRNHMVGVMLKMARDNARFTLDYLAEHTGLDTSLLRQYEYGQRPIPLAHLSQLASTLGVGVSFFLEENNRVARYLEAQEIFETFLDMDPDVRQFVAKSSNHRYIELAMKLAEMDVNKLRQVAENILEITY